jgi:methyltransferase (TIGR00027 family)
MRNCASLTAEYMALFRAIESARPARSRLFCDPFAVLFLHRWRKWIYEIARCGAARRLVERLFDRELPGARAAGIARTKWIDDEVTRALETCTQLVLLGAGFDTRAYRLPAAQRVVAFELDHPETSLAKQATLRKAMGSLPQQVQFVSIDFNTQPVADVLRGSSFDATQTTCFVWEGVTNYLSPEAVDGVLQQIAQTARGGILLFTYVHRSVLDEPAQFFGAEKLLSRLRSLGEPWTFGLHPEEMERYLAARKLRLARDLSVAEVWQRAGRVPTCTDTNFIVSLPLGCRADHPEVLAARPTYSETGRSPYLIRATAPRPMERSAETPAGTRSSKSRSRFVGPQRISNEMLSPAKFC